MKPLKGLEDLGDKKYSIGRLASIEGGKLGGKTTADSGHLLSICSSGGKVGGKVAYHNKSGIFGLSEEQKQSARINGGKVVGNKNAESGRVSELGKLSAKSANHPNNVKVKCVHCGKENNVGNNNRWHGDNCKHKQ